MASRLFEPYRALGSVTNAVPFATNFSRKANLTFIYCSVGRQFHSYNSNRLGICNVSDELESAISCLAVETRFVFAACRNDIFLLRRGRVVDRFDQHKHEVRTLLLHGVHMVSTDSSGLLIVWEFRTKNVYLQLQLNPPYFDIVLTMHPATYVNKILLASSQGTMQLWNVKTGKLIYLFDNFKHKQADGDNGHQNSITCVVQSPVIDIVGIGFELGQIVLHNLKLDEAVMRFSQNDWGAVTCLAFRLDKTSVLVSGSRHGHLAIWDLDERRVMSEQRTAHDSRTRGISSMICLPSEPVLVTSGGDNALREWIFDQPDGGVRLLRERRGHSQPPIRAKFIDASSILSAGEDSSMNVFSVVHESANKPLGRASFNKFVTRKRGLKDDPHRMPPITDFACETSKQSDWDGIVCVHRGLTQATSWNYVKGTMGAHRFKPPLAKEKQHAGQSRPKAMALSAEKVTACSVELTSCGNFVLIGYSHGSIHRYNVQSGLHRAIYELSDDLVRSYERSGRTICSVNVDAFNSRVFGTCRAGHLITWAFHNTKLINDLKLDCPALFSSFNRENQLIAVAGDDFVIRLYDTETQRIVRLFGGHAARLTAMTFSPNGRWLVSASCDMTVRTWHLPTSALIDCFLVPAICTSLSFSPSSDLLASTFVGNLAVMLWSNVSLFRPV